MADVRKESTLPGAHLSIAALIVSLGGSANFAYHLIITNPAQDAFMRFVSDSFFNKHGRRLTFEQLETTWSIIVSILYWGTMVGALLIQTFSKHLGRKRALTVANVMQAFSVSLAIYSYFATDYILYTISRFLLGIAQALALGIGPMYIMECSPARCRGVISLSTGLIMQSFIVLAAIVALPKMWGNDEDWWYLYAFELVELVLVTILSQFLPESPPVLQLQGKHAEAQKSIQYYHGVSQVEAEGLLSTEEVPVERVKDLGLFEVLFKAESRKGTVLGCTAMFAMCFSGLVVVNAFAIEILRNTGLSEDSAAYANVGICLISVVGILIAAMVVERFGRRPLVLFGIFGCAVANVAIFGFMFGYEKTGNQTLGWCLVATICIFILICCSTIAPLSFFLTSELVDAKARPAAATWANLILAASRSILLALFLPLKLWLGAPTTYLILFVPPLVFCFIFLYYRLPETKHGKKEADGQIKFIDEE
ncbi:unnamed protein product, partial [Mesorhabditis spiculigera]